MAPPNTRAAIASEPDQWHATVRREDSRRRHVPIATATFEHLHTALHWVNAQLASLRTYPLEPTQAFRYVAIVDDGHHAWHAVLHGIDHPVHWRQDT